MSGNASHQSTAAKSDLITEGDLSPLGGRWVGRNVTILLAVYLVGFALALAWGIIQLWPPPTAISDSLQPRVISLFFWSFPAPAEAHLLLLVILGSAIGTQAHVLRSLYWYVGNRQLKYSWMMRYMLMPFAGIALGLAFYFVIRGGFFSAGTSVDALSPYGFVAMAVLVGMFTDQAMERLKKVAGALFTEAPEGRDSSPASEKKP